MIEPTALAEVIEKQIKLAVDRSIEDYVEKTIAGLLLDPTWVSKIENIINQNFMRRFNEKLSMVDLNSLIRDNLDAGIDRFRDKLLQDFHTSGITDSASKNEITVMDDVVVVENQLVTKELLVDQDATVKGTLILNNLSVRGSINTDNRAWNELTNVVATQTLQKMTQEWQQQLVDQVLALAKTDGIDFDTIKIKGHDLVNGDTLNSEITKTNIEKTGTLKELTVSGNTSLNETLNVARRRVGINTTDPEMALSVWDEEVSVIMGKLSSQQAYVGTSRLQNLAIGVNRNACIEIDTDGLTTIKQLRVGQHRITHAREVPGYSGTRGDLVFNSDPKPESPFAWVCLGAFRWQPLKSA